MTIKKARATNDTGDKPVTHTPGPWVTIRGLHGNKDGLTVWPSEDQDFRPNICIVRELTDGANANALLIAAAPDLLHALIGMNHMGGDERGGYCICPLNDGSKPDERHATVCSDARKAIAKATGNIF